MKWLLNEITNLLNALVLRETFHYLTSKLLFHLKQFTCPKRVCVNCFKTFLPNLNYLGTVKIDKNLCKDLTLQNSKREFLATFCAFKIH